MRILITGGTGFVGTTLVPYLYDHGYKDIILLVRNPKKAKELFPNIPLNLIDTSTEWRDKVIDSAPDLVLHMATLFTGRSDAANVKAIVDTNILLTAQLLEALSQTDCKYFVNMGTFTEFLEGAGEYMPNNLYSASKTAVRPIIKFYQSQSQWQWINIILYSPYGRFNRQKKVIDYMVDAMDSPMPVNFSKGEQILDFIHVDDIADFFLTLFNKLPIMKDDFLELHLGTGEGHSIREVASVMENTWGKRMNANWGGIPYRPLDTMHAVAPIAKNLALLGWKSSITLQEGLGILKEDVEKYINNSGGVNSTAVLIICFSRVLSQEKYENPDYRRYRLYRTKPNAPVIKRVA
jgi:CDP-paratose synthetase